METGLRKVSTFITADALLAAAVLVWGQLWAKSDVSTADFGLAWTYCSVLLALAALAVAGWETLRHRDNNPTHYVAVRLFAAALETGALNVFQSLFTVSLNLIKGGLIYENPIRSEFPGGFWSGREFS